MCLINCDSTLNVTYQLVDEIEAILVVVDQPAYEDNLESVQLSDNYKCNNDSNHFLASPSRYMDLNGLPIINW